MFWQMLFIHVQKRASTLLTLAADNQTFRIWSEQTDVINNEQIHEFRLHHICRIDKYSPFEHTSYEWIHFSASWTHKNPKFIHTKYVCSINNNNRWFEGSTLSFFQAWILHIWKNYLIFRGMEQIFRILNTHAWALIESAYFVHSLGDSSSKAIAMK